MHDRTLETGVRELELIARHVLQSIQKIKACIEILQKVGCDGKHMGKNDF